MSLAVTWSLLNLPETESIQISRQPSITFLDKEGRIIASYGDIYGQTIQYKNLPKDFSYFFVFKYIPTIPHINLNDFTLTDLIKRLCNIISLLLQ